MLDRVTAVDNKVLTISLNLSQQTW